MFITALMWALLVLFWVLALGFALCVTIFLIGLSREISNWWKVRKWTHREWKAQHYDSWAICAFSLMTVLAAGMSMGCIFAALAMWRNVA